MVRATDGNTCWKEFTTGLKLYICVLKNVLSLSASLEYSLGLTFCSFFPRYWQVVSKLMYEVENHYFLCRMLLAAVTLFLLVLRTELEQCVSVCESKRQRSLSRKSRQSGLNHSLFFPPPPGAFGECSPCHPSCVSPSVITMWARCLLFLMLPSVPSG